MDQADEFEADASDSLIEVEIQAKDNEFVGVRIAEFYSPKAVLFDLFIKLGTGRYLKIFSAGDAYDEIELRSYESERGVRLLYLRLESRSRYVSFLSTIMQKIIPLGAVKLGVKFGVAKNLSELFIQEMFLADEKTRPALVEDGKRICSLIAGWIEVEPGLESFLVNLDEIESSIEALAFLTGIFTSVASRRFPWKSRRTTETLLLAAFLCDIGFASLPPELAKIKLKRMNEAQRKDFQRHPEISCSLLANCKTLGDNILTIVREHHEYCDGSGFPQKLKGNRILFLSKFICLCGDLVRCSSELLLPPAEAVKIMFPIRNEKIFTMHPEIASKYDSELLAHFFAIFGKDDATGGKP